MIRSHRALWRTTRRTCSTRQLDPFEYCKQDTKKKDYWSWYCSQFLPENLSSCHNAFHAFHHELINPEAQVRVNPSSDPMNGSGSKAKDLRTQWWKDQMSHIYVLAKQTPENATVDPAQIPAHPVLQALFLIMRRFALPKTGFTSLFRAHSDPTLPVTMEDVERYGNDSLGAIMTLTTDCYTRLYPDEFTGSRRLDIDHCLSHYAKAFSIFQLLRGTPSHISRRVCYLPLQLLSQHKISTEDLFRGDSPPEHLSDVVYEVASAAHLHLEHAEKLHHHLPKSMDSLVLPRVLVRDYLDSLQQHDFNVFHPNQHRARPLAWQAKILYSHYFNSRPPASPDRKDPTCC